MPRWPNLTLVERVYSKIDQSPGQGPGGTCWTWRGAKSRSRWRQKLVRYPTIQAGRGKRRAWMLRVNRLLLVIRDGPLDVPAEDGEEFLVWLARAWEHYRFQQAAHSCDNSECVNPGHLEWKTQEENLSEQWERRRAAGGGEDERDQVAAVAAG